MIFPPQSQEKKANGQPSQSTLQEKEENEFDQMQ
jgi:hypothetical protein